MIAELVSSALGLALYLNTLRADFCYDDRYSMVQQKHIERFYVWSGRKLLPVP
ncbi:hypothetical protein J1605_015419 [Eschrichtius robustus]|uniref:Uncharacterized protein n=1 Tax=Eschrichtius robustus TaxID=9764 RepID=A0AB34GDX6_ESCRO|nr:hypothetical protein J1605_015419 [Eschrichtius robustus]